MDARPWHRRDTRSALTRRQLLRPLGRGIGAAALASLLGRDVLRRSRGAARDRRPAAWPDCRTSRPRRSASSTCFSRAGRRSSTCSTTSRSSTKFHGKELPDSVRMGQRLTGMTSGQTTLPGRAVDVQVRAARPVRARGSASCCRTPAKIVDDICLIKIDAHRGDQPRPGDHVHPDRQRSSRAGRASARGSATAWAARTRTCRRSSC